MKKQHNKFSILTEEVKLDDRLDAYSKILFAEITSLTKVTGLCWASNAYLASRLNCSEKTITRRLKILENTGYIKIRKNNDKKTKNKTKRLITLISDEKDSEKVVDYTVQKDSTKNEKWWTVSPKSDGLRVPQVYNNIIDNKNTQPRSATDVSSLEVVYKAPQRCCKENPNFFEEKEGIKSTESIIPENKLITLWNKFPMLSTHENRSTKVYKRIDKYLTDILNNNFKEYEFDKDWKTDNKIKLSKLNNITEEKIIEAIFNHVEKFKKENKPLNKKYLAKAFDIFLYNPITRKSQFLYSLSHSVENVKAIDSEIQRKHLLSSVANKVDTMINYKRTKISAFNRNKIYMNVNRICKEFEPIVEVINLQKDNPNFIYINSVEKITLEWLKFLDKKDTVKEIDFTTFSYEYTKFLEDVEIRYNLSVDTSPRNRTFLKTREDRVKEVIKVDRIENDIYGLGE